MSIKKKFFFIKKNEITAIIILFLFTFLIFGMFFLLAKNEEYFSINNISLKAQKVKPINIINKKEVLEDEIISPSYPVAVMFDNYFSARPQLGISKARFIYETLVEGGTTRFMGILDVNKEIEKIGPIRSARPYFVEWVNEYQALYIHAGGSPAALKDIKTWQINDLNEINGIGQYYSYRDKKRYAPHNLFTDSGRLKKALAVWGLSEYEDSWLYKDDLEFNQRGNNDKILIDFTVGNTYDANFIYNQEDNIYIRRQDNRDMMDGKKLVTANNVIVQFIPAEKVLDKKLRLDLDIYGSGKAILWQDGLKKNIFWKKDTLGQPTKFFDKDDKSIKLNYGLTWIIIVPGDREVY